MALVGSRNCNEQLHGSIEMIEDSSEISLTQRQEQRREYVGTRQSEKAGLDHGTSIDKKDDIVLVTVKPLITSASSSQSSVPQTKSEASEELHCTTSIKDDLEPVLDQAASRRRYSVMMASLAAARVEESKAALALRSNIKSSPSNSTGMSADTAIDGWKWQTRRDREDDFAMREKHFADEL